MIRSVLAVFAGIVVLTVTSFAIEAAADPLMMWMFPHALPNQAAMSQNVPAKLFMMLYTMICVAAGGYVTAWLARRSKVWHAVVMGVVEAALTVWVMVKFPAHAPLWSWILGIGLIVPAAWLGGVIRAKRTKFQPS
jgi:hypothetical protein